MSTAFGQMRSFSALYPSHDVESWRDRIGAANMPNANIVRAWLTPSHVPITNNSNSSQNKSERRMTTRRNVESRTANNATPRASVICVGCHSCTLLRLMG